MARYDDSQPYTPDYEDDCHGCGGEYHRGDLAWVGDDLLCSRCEDAQETATAKKRELARLFATKELAS